MPKSQPLTLPQICQGLTRAYLAAWLMVLEGKRELAMALVLDISMRVTAFFGPWLPDRTWVAP